MRFFFLDGSALAKRYVAEPGTPLLDQFATDAIVLHAALGLAQHRRSRGDDLILVASDKRLLRAAQAEGLGTFDPEIQDQAALALLMGP